MGSIFKTTLNTRALPTGDMRYIRSDCPWQLSDEEVKWLKDHDITTIVDLRDEKECDRKPCRLENEDGFKYFHLPVTGGGSVPKSPECVPDSYISMIDEQMETIVDTIMNAKGGAMYFCSAGKDRTGVVSAIILKKLGYSDSEIIDDYMQTKDNLKDYVVTFAKEHPEIDMGILVPNEKNIQKVLEFLR